MSARFLATALALATLAVAAPVKAQDNDAPKDTTKGAYVSVGVGGNWASNPTFSSADSGTFSGLRWTENNNGNVSLGGGVSVSPALGYDFGNNIRAELSYTYNALSIGQSTVNASGTLGGFSYSGNGTINTTGTLSTNSVFVSGYYDIPTKSKFTPYVGAGIGWTGVSVPAQNVSATVTVDGTRYTLPVEGDGGSGSAFGYQAKIGVSYAVSQPADVFLEGIYQGNTSVTIGRSTYGSLNDFGVRAGVRYRFGT
jgi:opacity protein-like surface antigen